MSTKAKSSQNDKADEQQLPQVGTHAWLRRYLGHKTSAWLRDATVARIGVRGEIIVSYQNQDIYTITPSNMITLNSHNSNHPAIKARYNRYLPIGVSVFVDRGLWWIQDRRGVEHFYDGIQIDSAGYVVPNHEVVDNPAPA